jgi:hypothetical protein
VIAPARRNLVILVVALAVVAAAGSGAGLLLHQRSARGRYAATPSAASSSATGPAPSTSASGSTSRSADGAAALGLPGGGPVPAGFTTVSATTTARGITYLLGSAPCRTAPCTSVLRYDGSRWRGLAAPRATVVSTGPSAAPNTVRDVRFGSPRDGWAYGGALWSTHDGARRWHEVAAGGAVVDLASDGTTTYAVVARCAGPAGGCRVRLRSTPVGHDDWRDVPGVAVAGSSGRLGVAAGTAVVSFVDSGAMYLRHGHEWRAAEVRCPDRSASVVPSASSRRLFAFCGSPGAGNLDFAIRYSDDGRLWTDVPVGSRHLRIPNATFVALTAESSTVLLAASGDPSLGGPVMVSRDGGRTWGRASGRGGLPDLDSGPAGGWRYVGASSATRVIALAAVPHHGYWVSEDGARSWEEIVPR